MASEKAKKKRYKTERGEQGQKAKKIVEKKRQ